MDVVLVFTCVCVCWRCLCVVSSLNARDSLQRLTCRLDDTSIVLRKVYFSFFRVALPKSIRRASIIILSKRIVQPFGRMLWTNEETHTLSILLSFCVMNFTGADTHTHTGSRSRCLAWLASSIYHWIYVSCISLCASDSSFILTQTHTHALMRRHPDATHRTKRLAHCARPLSHRRDRRADVCWTHSDGGWACAVCHCGFHCVPITWPHRVDRMACCAMNRSTLIGRRSIPTHRAPLVIFPTLCLCAAWWIAVVRVIPTFGSMQFVATPVHLCACIGNQFSRCPKY